MKTLALAALAFATIFSVPAAAGASPVYIVRHMEKSSGDDPVLSAVGAANAERLAELLADAGIKAVFATATRRAQQSATPLAARVAVPVTTYDPADVDALVKSVAAVGGPVLIVGHSNTVPNLVARFGGARPAAIAEDEYGTIYVVQAASMKRGEIRLRL